MRPRPAKWFERYGPRTSLQAIVTYPFVFLILVTVIVTGFFSFYYSGKAIDGMAGQLMEKDTSQIQDRIMRLLDRAHLVNEINANAIETGQIDLKRMTSMEVHFWNQVRSFEYISYSYLGSAEGGFFGARRLADGTLQIIATKTLTGGEILYFNTDRRGRRTEVSSTIPSYDHKTRPWYKAAIQAGKPTWSPVFVDAGGEGLTITAAKPLYDASGKIKGVLGSSFIFSHINQFLRSLKIGESGLTFVMERSGMLVATSTPDPTSTADKKRIAARESGNPLIRHASRLIFERLGDLSGIDRRGHLSLDIKGERYFVHFTPFQDGRGIDWLIAVVVPENDFMSSVKESHRNTILLSLVALILTIIAGFIIARRITRPILELNHASKSLAAGEWSQVIEIDRRDEIGELAKSFNLMARQLRDAIENLEQKVTERTAEIMDISRKHSASEKKYRQLYENLRDGSVMVDMEGKITEFNTAFQNMIGYTAGEIPLLTFTDITPTGWHAMEREILAEQVLKRGYSDLYEKEYIKKDGTIFPVEISIYLVRDEDGNPLGFWAFVRDITDRRQAEEALKESESWYRTIFENTGTATVIIDENTTLILANAEYEKLSGHPKNELENKKSWMDFVVKEDLDRMIASHRQRRIDKEAAPRSYEFRFRDQSGNIKNIFLTIDMIPGTKMSVASLLDITKRKATEEALRESEARFRAIFNSTFQFTGLLTPDGTVIEANQTALDFAGITMQDIVNRPFWEARWWGGDETRVQRLKDAIKRAGAGEFIRYETDLQGAGDTAAIIDFSLKPVFGASGEIILLIPEGREITGQKRSEEERKALEERLQRSEKMEALGTLAGGVAHDLNNVLGVLVGYSELIAERLPEDSPLRKYAINILQSSVRGAAIIQDLLTLARRGVTVSEVVDLNRLVSDYLRTPEFENLKSHHPHVKMRTNLEEELLKIKGSPVHLGKTIMNLMSNAAEAISGRGEVTVRTENRYLDQPIHGYDEMKEGDYVVLTVSDTGSGISANDLGKIFEPFYTKKVMGRSGTGLGLAVVWGAVKDHHGYIDVWSEEGKGSTFTLYLPVTRDESAETEKTVSPAEYKGRGESILVVDDVKEQRELAASMLERLGYRVETAAGGVEAIEYIKNKKADLVVLDMIMDPGIDGMETYRGILEISPGQRAIIVSGFSETDRVRQAQDMGAGAFVRKPYILEKIGLAVRRELDRT
jgi:PAS domain S-box-containing protein